MQETSTRAFAAFALSPAPSTRGRVLRTTKWKPPLSVSFSSAVRRPENQTLTYHDFRRWRHIDGSNSVLSRAKRLYRRSVPYRMALDDQPTSPASQGIHRKQIILLQMFSSSARDVINFSGTATDQEDGPLPPASLLVDDSFHHDTQFHPPLSVKRRAPSPSRFRLPTRFPGNTATKASNARLTDCRHSSVFVFPHKVNLTFVTEPAGLTVNVGGISHVTPYVLDTLTGFQHLIDAPNQTQGSVIYSFGSWSDGGAQSHTITAGEVAATYTAAYQGVSTVTASPSGTTF